MIFNPVLIACHYIKLRNKYFPDSYPINLMQVNSQDMEALCRFLDKEQIDPVRYIDFVFSTLEYKHPLTPKGLKNPELILKYREMIR